MSPVGHPPRDAIPAAVPVMQTLLRGDSTRGTNLESAIAEKGDDPGGQRFSLLRLKRSVR